MLRMYTELADWWTLLSPVDDYAEEAAVYERVLNEHAPTARTLLELGAGGGNNAFFMKRRFQMTLADLSADMLRQSMKINADLEHVVGDMRTLRLKTAFDAVFIHDAISYMTSRDDLKAAITTAAAHLSPGGIALFAPDETRESFRPGTDCGGVDEGARGFRYLEWFWDPDPSDDTLVADYAFLFHEAEGEATVVHERHTHGVFSRAHWLETLEACGFEPSLTEVEHSDVDRPLELFIGRKR
jgi:trans-aconitate methyltransferase